MHAIIETTRDQEAPPTVATRDEMKSSRPRNSTRDARRDGESVRPLTIDVSNRECYRCYLFTNGF